MLNSLIFHVLDVVPVGVRVNYSTLVVHPSHRHQMLVFAVAALENKRLSVI